MLCYSLLELLPPSINTAVQSLKRSAEKYIQSNASVGEPLFSCLEKLEKSVEQFVADYCSYFRVGYQLQDRLLEEEIERVKPRLKSSSVSAPLKVYVGCVGRLPKSVRYVNVCILLYVVCEVPSEPHSFLLKLKVATNGGQLLHLATVSTQEQLF